MRKFRWLPASLLALVLSTQAVWSQTTTIQVQGLPLLPRTDLIVAEGRNPGDVNQARPEVHHDATLFTESLTTLTFEECLQNWALMWQLGNYSQAQELADRAVQIEPGNVAAQHASVLTRIVSKLGLNRSESCTATTATTSCAEGTCQSLTRRLPASCAGLTTALGQLFGGSCCTQVKATAVCPVSAKCAADACCADECAGAKTGVQAVDCKGSCCKEGKCSCCGKCCKAPEKASSVRPATVFPQLEMMKLHLGMQPPMVITGFGPMMSPPGCMMPPAGPDGAPVFAQPVMPLHPGMQWVPNMQLGKHRLMSRPAQEEPGQAVYQINATGQQVHITTPNLEAHCRHMTCLGTRDRVLLEGDVRLTCRKDGQVTRIEAPRVLVDLVHGTFTVETGTTSTSHRPASVGTMQPMPSAEQYYLIRPTNFTTPLPYHER